MKEKLISTPICFKITPALEKRLKELMELRGATTFSEIIRTAVYEMSERKNFDLSVARNSPGRPKKTVEDKSNDLVEQLEGVIVDYKGNKLCRYKVYELVNPKLVEIYDQEISVSLLTMEMVEKQYRPSKEECLKVLKKMKNE